MSFNCFVEYQFTQFIPSKKQYIKQVVFNSYPGISWLSEGLHIHPQQTLEVQANVRRD